MSDTVEVCPICDIAECHHIRERRQETADEIARLRAELAEEQRISTERGNHIEFELLPQMADLTMRAKELEAELAETQERNGKLLDISAALDAKANALEAELATARERVAGAYLAAADRLFYEDGTPIGRRIRSAIQQLTPADAKSALEARDARMIKSGYETGFNEGYEKRQFEEWEVRAEERAKIDLLVGAATALEANLGVKGVNVGSLRVRLHEALIALHTPESRARAPRSVDANKQADIGSKEGE